MNIAVDSEDTAQALIDVALIYAEHGWSVFPCKPDKRPYIERGFLDATRNAEQIAAWWKRWPDAAIGVACGASNLVVIDYDPGHDVNHEGFQRLVEMLGEVETRQSNTGSGGRHYLFLAPPGSIIRNSAGKLGPGIDVRGDGGYIIVPPSSNQNGVYRWHNKAKLAMLPETIARVIREAQPEARQREAATTEQGMIPEGQRNATLTSMAGTLWRRGMSPLAVEQALLAENQEHCNPPLPEDEVRAIAHSITRYPASEPVLKQGPHSTEPEVELLASDALRVSVTLGDGVRAAFTFTEMEKEKRELACHMALAFFGGGEPYQQRVNLESNSARTELRRELDNLYGKDKGWAAALNTVWNLARQSFLTQDRGVRLNQIPLLLGSRFLVPPLMPSEGVTIFFGDGSSAKSYVALGLALASVTGVPLAGQYTAPRTNVLYVDYEDSDQNFRRRAHRILTPLGLTAEDAEGIVYWHAGGVPLADQWDAIKRSCDQNDVGWFIVDSAAPACGGPAEESQSAVKFFNAIKRIGRPALVIAHVVKSDAPQATQKPFGTAFWHNLSRRTWFVARSQEQESDVIENALYCRKVNDGQLPRPQGFTITFDGEDGPVTFETADPNANDSLSQHSSVYSRVYGALERQPLTTKEIAELTGDSVDAVQKALRNHKDKFYEVDRVHDGSRGQPQKVWSIIRPEDREEFSF